MTMLAARFRTRKADRPFAEGLFPTEFAPMPPLPRRAWSAPADEDAIPDVAAIRIVHGADQGEYRPVEGPQGREWLRLDGSGARIAERAARSAYEAGRLAILSSVPPVPTKALAPVWTDLRPEPASPIDLRAEGQAWKLGFDLGRDGEDPAMPTGVSARVRMAFASGLEAGMRQRDEDLDLESERVELMWLASGHLEEEFAEMRMSPR